jgi:hypothetical protein
MFFTRTALEQATDEWVAAHKAARLGEFLRNSQLRFGETRLLADLCCGIGGDLLALSSERHTIGVDLNPIASHLAAANARVVLNQEVEINVQDVAEFDLARLAAWHIDPDRRTKGHRTTSLDHSTPDRAIIDRLIGRSPNGAIKLAPATTVPAAWADRCEREWISRDGECRQQVAWHGGLAVAPGQHRATVISSPPRYFGEGVGYWPARTIIGQPNQPIPLTDKVARYIFGIDPAVRAARLTGTLAAEHDLRALATGPTYLTGDIAIANDPALACFEVLERLPLRTRPLSQLLRTRYIGKLEIKKPPVAPLPF